MNTTQTKQTKIKTTQINAPFAETLYCFVATGPDGSRRRIGRFFLTPSASWQALPTSSVRAFRNQLMWLNDVTAAQRRFLETATRIERATVTVVEQSR